MATRTNAARPELPTMLPWFRFGMMRDAPGAETVPRKNNGVADGTSTCITISARRDVDRRKRLEIAIGVGGDAWMRGGF